MTTILGLSGSLRSGSYNTALLRAAAGLMPAGARLDIATLHGVTAQLQQFLQGFVASVQAGR